MVDVVNCHLRATSKQCWLLILIAIVCLLTLSTEAPIFKESNLLIVKLVATIVLTLVLAFSTHSLYIRFQYQKLDKKLNQELLSMCMDSFEDYVSEHLSNWSDARSELLLHFSHEFARMGVFKKEICKYMIAMLKTKSSNEPIAFLEQLIRIDRELAVGRFGQVFEAYLAGVGRVAIKSCKSTAGHLEKNCLKSELDIMIKLSSAGHINIVRLIGAINVDEIERLGIVTEFCDTDLHRFLVEHRENFVNQVVDGVFIDEPFDEDNLGEENLCTHDLLSIVAQVIEGMNYVHGCGVIHRHLDARNVLLVTTSDRIVVKLCDFGLAKDIEGHYFYHDQTATEFPVKCVAPEHLFRNRSDKKSDVWSFSILCAELFGLGAEPYPDHLITYNFNINDWKSQLHGGLRPFTNRPRFCPTNVYEMMTHCWQFDPVARPDFEQLKEVMGNILLQDLE